MFVYKQTYRDGPVRTLSFSVKVVNSDAQAQLKSLPANLQAAAELMLDVGYTEDTLAPLAVLYGIGLGLDEAARSKLARTVTALAAKYFLDDQYALGRSACEEAPALLSLALQQLQERGQTEEFREAVAALPGIVGAWTVTARIFELETDGAETAEAEDL